MAITCNLEGILRQKEEKQACIAQIQKACDEKNVLFDMKQNTGNIYVCPLGVIQVIFTDYYVTLTTNTALAGPGYHAAVCELYETIQKSGDIVLNIDDECEYLSDHDFQRLKENYFDNYLHTLLSNMSGMSDTEEAVYSWDDKNYLPLAKEGKIITPYGYITAKKLREMTFTEAEDLFYVWKNIEKDALFYRNSALISLWSDCVFEHSAQSEKDLTVAKGIVEALEKAHQLDKNLSLPVDEYQLLCKLLRREIKIFDVQQIHEDLIGYRREAVLYVYGNWFILEKGYAMQSFDGNTMILEVREEDEVLSRMSITGYRFDKEVEDYAHRYLNTVNAVDVFDIDSDNIRGRAVLHQLNDESQTLYLHAQLISGKETLMINCECADMNTVGKVRMTLNTIIYMEQEKNSANVGL